MTQIPNQSDPQAQLLAQKDKALLLKKAMSTLGGVEEKMSDLIDSKDAENSLKNL